MKRTHTQRQRGGRRRFTGSKNAKPEVTALPFGKPVAYFILADRTALTRFLPAEARGQEPCNLEEIANLYFHSRRSVLCLPAALLKSLQQFDTLNAREQEFNAVELPAEVLRNALKNAPAAVLKQFPVVRRALARLYALTWQGRGSDAAEARKQLEALIPTGNAHFTTAQVPALADEFARRQKWIRHSDERIRQECLKRTELERHRMLATLYGEHTGTIGDALNRATKAFVTIHLTRVLGVPEPTVKAALRGWTPQG